MKGAQTFRASPLWTANIFGVAVLGVGCGGLAPVALALLSWTGHIRSLAPPVLTLLGINSLVCLLGYFPGNLGAFCPHAVDVDPALGLTLHGPFKKVFIPISEVADVQDTLSLKGSVIYLSRPRVALTQFIIPWYFGCDRNELVRTIKLATQQLAE